MAPRYHNRELSVLDFQERVLALSEDPNLPILERVKYLAIVANNLDEFFQVRVAGLREQVATGVVAHSADGLLPTEQLDAVRERIESIDARLNRVVEVELIPSLVEHGIDVVDWASLRDHEREQLSVQFTEEIYPVLTPLAVDPAHPFPYISNLSMNLAVIVRDPRAGIDQFARIKVPPLLPRFLITQDDRHVPVEQVIGAHLGSLFPGLDMVGYHAFRVTRSADQAVEEEEADDLLEAMEALLQSRHRFSRLIRLEVADDMPEEVLQLLVSEMGITDQREVYRQRGLLNLAGFWTIYGLDRPELKDPLWIPTTQPELADIQEGESLFDRISRSDILVHLPYDSFRTSVGAFIAAAARDPQVLAIKQTLYRTADPGDPALGGEEAIVNSLVSAARSGKQVVVLVELKARFDEEANITWARILEEAGVHVVYGVVGLKTHAKIALVVRRETGGLRRYSHIGTGNYNPKTARLYEDLGVFTARDEIGADLSELFNVLTGFAKQSDFRQLLVAPRGLSDGIIERIQAQAALGENGRITFKLNHLVDPEIIDELYSASSAGVQIDLTIRGICCIRPGVAGLSENIRVRSLIGRYLEHSRIFKFGDGDEAEYLMGSADMMTRNLKGRVEALVPIEDTRLKTRIEELLAVVFADDRLAWELHDDQWIKVPTEAGLNSHLRFQSLALTRAQGAAPDPALALQTPDVVVAAGGVVTRVTDKGRTRVLLVHRPAYDDWSFPKGKVDVGEAEDAAALREVQEETGITARLGAELGTVEYVDLKGTRKIVRYWAMEAVDGEFEPNPEVDETKWMSLRKALDTLSYERDRALLRSTMDIS
jgi:polyphosphate kinase